MDVIYLDFCKAFDKVPHRRSTKFIHLNCNLIKLILQIPRPPFLDLHLSISNGFV